MLNRTVILALAVCSLASAQYTTASLGGTVSDTTGDRISGVKISVKNSDTGFALTTDTGEGTFLFPRLPVGNHELTADKTGFSNYVQKGIQLTMNQAADQAIVLKVGQVTETQQWKRMPISSTPRQERSASWAPAFVLARERGSSRTHPSHRRSQNF